MQRFVCAAFCLLFCTYTADAVSAMVEPTSASTEAAMSLTGRTTDTIAPFSSAKPAPAPTKTAGDAIIPTASSPAPSMSTSSGREEEGEDAGLSTGAVAGIVVGSAVGVAAVAGVGTLTTVLIVKAVKGGSKVSPIKKGDASGECVKVEKQSLIDTLPKPE